MLRLAASLITIAMAQEDLADGLADVGTAELALLPGQQGKLPLQLLLHRKADEQRVSREMPCASV